MAVSRTSKFRVATNLPIRLRPRSSLRRSPPCSHLELEGHDWLKRPYSERERPPICEVGLLKQRRSTNEGRFMFMDCSGCTETRIWLRCSPTPTPRTKRHTEIASSNMSTVFSEVCFLGRGGKRSTVNRPLSVERDEADDQGRIWTRKVSVQFRQSDR
ncbi:hypothetical protein BGZ61DRAFT_469064 [Ilyonectria robusta]|uniref:uncharacterized protein n=1 Tax=Ilyonectria robusta TaxID=1079257 RepID=UPI001E8E9075|nr:uncharacterized protein BGZ61DRAFT_469064 [Ilyonectria robusta]KAH8651677.1 hypothetical protein BGZ61DRAFT_469064 [Ilyonectria robusta]